LNRDLESAKQELADSQGKYCEIVRYLDWFNFYNQVMLSISKAKEKVGRVV